MRVADELIERHPAARLLWVVNRVTLGAGRPLPVYLDEQTFSESVGMSQTCQCIIGNIMIACEPLFGGASSAVLVFATRQDTVLSLIFVPLTYFGPCMFKSFVTLRTGNDWIHALGYHAVAPRVLFDTPLTEGARNWLSQTKPTTAVGLSGRLSQRVQPMPPIGPA
jgi:hypothetical protein